MSAMSKSKIDYAIAKLNEIGLASNSVATRDELDIIALDAAAELAQLRVRLDVACSVKATDKVGFDWAILDTIAKLHAELDEAKKVIRHAWIDGAHEDARKWLNKYGKDGDE